MKPEWFKNDQKLYDWNFSSFENVFRRLFLFDFPLKQDLKGEPGQEENQLG
jgi:hypothetical protein